MSMLDIHTEALESSNVAFNEFLLFYRLNRRQVYGFVEGKQDPSFYRGFIDALLPDRWSCKLIPAGDKARVLKLTQFFDWSRFPKNRICFFVDRDLSDLNESEKQAEENVYVSAAYSIENDIVSVGTFMRVLDEIKTVGPLRPEEASRIEAQFLQNTDRFVDAMLSVMAQIVIWRKAERSDARERACLDRINLNTFFSFDNGELNLKPPFEDKMMRVRYAAEVTGEAAATEAELKSIEAELTVKGKGRFTRGKFLLWHFVECSEAIRRALPALFGRHLEAPGTNGGLGLKNAVMILGPRAKCPKCLRNFLERTYVNFCVSASQLRVTDFDRERAAS